MQTQKIRGAAARAAGARGVPGNGNPARKAARKLKEWYTIVVYERRRVRTVVLYVGRETFTFKMSAKAEILGVVLKRWQVGKTTVAYSMSIHAVNLARLIDAYMHDVAARKISVFDPVYRAAALRGYKAHDNEAYVKLWLEHELGEPLFHTGDPLERKLGDCIKYFSNSYNMWRMVTPPWAAAPC
jgi:hypothetical protein